MQPPELSVGDEQLILTTSASGGKQGLKELVAALRRQPLHHHVNI